jgi:nucleotide-binding universal stress UspA family protein
MKTGVTQTAGFRNILFATDFSPAAAHAIPYIKRIAKYYDANLIVLHVRPSAVNPMTEPAYWPDEETARKENEMLRQQLLDTFAGIRTIALIQEGNIQFRLREAITKNNSDLVVIGTRGHKGISEKLLGSVAENIFRTSTCPVLTVGPHADTPLGAHGKIRAILHGTGLTSPSPAAAAYAVSLALKFQARLVMLQVIAEPKAGERVSVDDATQAAKDLLRKLVPPKTGERWKLEFFVERGNPADRILELAHLQEAGLIVLGAKAEEGVPGAATHLPNATAHKVVARAECPVLTVRS